METLDKGIEGKNITNFFARKAEAAKAFDIELDGMCDLLKDLIPEEMKAWYVESLSSEDIIDGEMIPNNKRFKEFVGYVFRDTERGHNLLYEEKDPEDYDFTDQDDLIRRYNLLKEAWSGIINVEIYPPVEGEDYYTSVRFSIAQ